MGASLWVTYCTVVLVGALIVFRWRRTKSGLDRRSIYTFWTDENGASGTIDLALTSAVYLPIVMCTVQFFFILNAYQFVKYSSYCAARAAIVVIPESDDGGRNKLSDGKKEVIREAAAFALSPVSPTVARVGGAASTAQNTTYAKGIETVSQPVLSQRISSGHARHDMWWAKYGNALDQTEIEVKSGASYNLFDAVVVEVSYEYCLTLPFAKRLLRQGSNALGGYRTLRSRCVMMNEGAGEKPSDF